MDFPERNPISQLMRSILPVGIFIVFSLVLFSLSRLILVIWQFPRVMAADGLLPIFLQGIRFDFVLFGVVLLLPLILTPLMHISATLGRLWKPVLIAYLVLLFSLFVFIEAATPSFIIQYDLRPNVWFIEYLKYPDEVFSTLYKAYKLQLLLAITLTLGASYYLFARLKKSVRGIYRVKWWAAFLAVPLLVFLCLAATRSTLDHRAVNPGTVVFSSDPLMNTLPLSSAYSVLYAAYQLKNEQKNTRPYGDMDSQEVVSEVKKAMGLDESLFVSKTLPTLHRHQPTRVLAKRKNLVIVLMESLGGEYVGKMGGLPLTPYIDRLVEEGLWFENLYATGTRSVRGIEAIISGYLPTTARSVVKLPQAQNGFFTIASVLKDQGYNTSFIYGGEGQFDNMASFFSGNGFDKIIDQDEYIDPVFYGSWGVPDEDLFKKADQVFSQIADDQPFFSLVFTASNHSPYDFPEGRIELYEEPSSTKNNAAKYTDFAVGEFIKKARQSSYWDNTVFLIISDHNSRVLGADLVPIPGFHIPALILGKDIEPQKISRIASQIDMLPTLLSLIGVEAEIPTTGIDLTRADVDSIPGRAIMQYAGNQAYMEEGRVVILTPGYPPQHYRFQDKQLSEATEPDPGLEKKALAHSIWPSLAYRNRLYRSRDQEK